MITDLCNTYSDITRANLEHNNQNMARSWNPPTPIKYLFEQLRIGHEISTEGGDAPLDTQLVHLGYNIIHKKGLFETTCLEWQKK